MIYPSPTPLFPEVESVCADIRYERRFTAMNDVTHDDSHIHDFYEIYVNLSGDVSFLVEGRLYPIRRGDVIVTSPNELHRCIYRGDCIHEHFCIWIKSFPGLSGSGRFGRSTLVSLPDDERENLIDLCFSLYKSRRRGGDACFRAAGSFFGILDLVCSGRPQSTQAQNLPERFAGIVDYISRHFSEPSCGASAICDRFFISRSTLLRLFRQYFQTSPSAYIEAKRLSEAKKLLMAGQSVQECCFRCGYSDCSYFIVRFSKRFGMTPHRYQKEYMESVPDL